MFKDAKLSVCRKYRYALWRVWDESKDKAMFVCLNPSTADETIDDPTLVRCINFASSWGYGAVVMANLFAFRATDPDDMKIAKNPIGEENDQWLMDLSKNASIVICAWGNDGGYKNRANSVNEILTKQHYLKLNKSGEPAHPLYLRKNLNPVKWDNL
ncbi:MAG: DUF1643 domain-containing protein [Lentisphaeria bacterium]|nr:DUF1643 domain-containing protein [Lentisphaeria bacterium]NQZ68889.1 DUF1643 domain-containing protein [Lentisphaeria bacterium]